MGLYLKVKKGSGKQGRAACSGGGNVVAAEQSADQCDTVSAGLNERRGIVGSDAADGDDGRPGPCGYVFDQRATQPQLLKRSAHCLRLDAGWIHGAKGYVVYVGVQRLGRQREVVIA